ncbi:MAG: N-acetyl-alpha-D-glucosaminyl L-malate synthase BshA [Bacteroidetes bacterium]|nr:N-acetyl-alpha-D-glucosaminyl L-malate synthase BshA [Bacteroidota bacterium]MBK9798338.1 N-acetyl-alpha-D-glucosaminyl L-malate synthase BshA [Bacteroidota bacterium]MBP6413931.1 N-acetyl-alpha-D-glucosaminyl L-malate synthase BshA [Bacteroidia bacterium]
MKIGIVCYPTFGGSGVVATELGIELALKGHQIHFISYSQPVRLDFISENIFYHEVAVSDYPLFDFQPYELVLSSKLVDVVKYEKLDLLHVHYAIPHASAAYMAKQILASQGINIPFITTLHGTDITLVGKDASFEPVITFAINQSDAVTSVSESLKEDTYKHFAVTREIQVIPNFVKISDYQKHEADCSRSVFASNKEKILMHISNFRKVKRVEDVLHVFDKVRKVIPSKLIMIGDGPERTNIEKLCRELDTCNDIRMLGKVTDPIQILSIADVFILPSETESFGLAALEAMASKVPVISTNTGGLPEVNIDGYSGYLCNVADVDQMVAKTISLLENEDTLKKFKLQAFEQAKKFDIEKILPQYEALYNKVLKK